MAKTTCKLSMNKTQVQTQAAAEGDESAQQKLAFDAVKVAELQDRVAAGDEEAVGMLRATGNAGV